MYFDADESTGLPVPRWAVLFPNAMAPCTSREAPDSLRVGICRSMWRSIFRARQYLRGLGGLAVLSGLRLARRALLSAFPC